MKYYIQTLVGIIVTSLSVSAQGADKLAKNFRVTKTPDYNPSATFTVRPPYTDRMGITDALKNSFVAFGLKVVSETSLQTRNEYDERINLTDSSITTKGGSGNTTYVKSTYLITFNYEALYNMYGQCCQGRNIRGQVVDLANNSVIVATFTYTGNFDVYPISDAIAQALSRK